jgi:hypothetical protein
VPNSAIIGVFLAVLGLMVLVVLAVELYASPDELDPTKVVRTPQAPGWWYTAAAQLADHRASLEEFMRSHAASAPIGQPS